MKMNDNEMMKLFDFILENKNVIISDSGLFSRDTLIMIRAIVKGKIPNDFTLTKEQEQLIIDAFIKSNNSFDEDTPSFIMENFECVKLSITRNVNSIDYIQNISSDLESYVIENALKHGFVLKKNSPVFLKNNFSIALNSIRLDLTSADYIDWNSMNEEEANNLIDEMIKLGYVLSSNSHNFLTENIKIVMESLKKDINNIKYAGSKVTDDPVVFKYLILNGYNYDYWYIKRRTLNYFFDEEVLRVALKKLFCYGLDDEKYIQRFSKLYSDAINSQPTIKTFDSVFQSVAEERWKEHRKRNIDEYDNIFGKICAELRNSDNLDEATANLKFLEEMEITLGEKYIVLYKAMTEYFNIFHSVTTNKLQKLETSKDTIAKLSALYVSKSKENYKKQKIEDYYDCIREYFTLRIENPYINKRLIQSQKKDMFKKLYQDNDPNVCDFINNLAQTYSKNIDSNTVWKLINNFINYNASKIGEVIDAPYNYRDYVKYEKAIKLIHRLNSGYIQYDDAEVFKYRNIISYDNKKEEYVYIGKSFNDDSLKAYGEYRRKAKIFEKIKKDIMLKVQSIELNGEINENMVEALEEDLPFTDEYFKFDTDYVLGIFELENLFNASMNKTNGFNLDSFTSDEVYANVYNLLVNNGLIWLLIFINNQGGYDLKEHGIRKDDIIKIVNNMKDITKLAQEFKFDLNNFGELLLVHKMSSCADKQSLAILGKEVVEKIYKSREYTDSSLEEIISMAKELVSHMVKRSKSTVPYVSGNTMNYNYSLYDSQDETILVSGIDTDACFKIDGTDNDFLHYCALDKNGFVIKITDGLGNFIARASGFRNGNCIFINQLRTIYDEGGNYYNGEYANEKNDIIETFKKACEDIVITSQKNTKETNKIDFVFVTKSYSLSDYKSNVSDALEDKIGSEPMDMVSGDWQEFVNNTKNLKEASKNNPFMTDYGDYSLICMASSKILGNVKPRNIKLKDVPALYERKRNKIIITNKSTLDLNQKINKIRAIKSFFDETEFKSFEIPDSSTIFIGDNWYIIFNEGNIISSCLLDFDSKAKIEFEATKQIIIQLTLDNNQQSLNIEQITRELQLESSSGYSRALKIR